MYGIMINIHTHIPVGRSISCRKPISSLSFSHDGKYLAVGDCGHNPGVRIWDITSSNEEHIVELTGHNYGISCTVSWNNCIYNCISNNIFINFINLHSIM